MSLFGDFKPHRLTGLLLTDRGTLNRVSVCLNPQSDDIATAQLAIDGEIEKRQIALAIGHLKLGTDRPDVLRRQRWFSASQLAFVPRDIGFSLSCMVALLFCENDQHGLG